jgi:hypothetical protein
LYLNENKALRTPFVNVLPNKVLAKELVKLPSGFNHCIQHRSVWLVRRWRSIHFITDAGDFYLKHMQERHLGLAPKCLVVKKEKKEKEKKKYPQVLLKIKEGKARCEDIKSG